MALDLSRETALPLSEAARLIRARRGQATSPTTLWRWSAYGKDTPGGKVFLEVTYDNGRLVTSAEALARFRKRLGEAMLPGRIRSPAARRKACAAAGKRLEASGA